MSSGCYVLIHKLSDKKYVGQTNNLRRRIYQHASAKTDSLIHRAIRKHGLESFNIVFIPCEKEHRDELEEFLIDDLNALQPNGYNVTTGGYSLANLPRTEQHREKISKALKGISRKGQYMPTAFKKGHIPINKGVPQPEAQRKAHSERMKGRVSPTKSKPMSEDTKQKLREAKLGKPSPMKGMKTKPCSEDQKQRMRDLYTGIKREPRSEETKRKISESLKRRNAELTKEVV